MANCNTQPINKEWYHYLPTTATLARFVPTPRRPSTISLRYLIGARRYQNATNCPWHKLPKEFGNSKTIYNRLLDWSRKGIFSKAFDTIAFEKGDFTRIDIDSTFGKCKRTAMSFRSDGEDCCCGLSKGGTTSKIHMMSDACGRPVATKIAKGQQSDIKGLRNMYPKLEDIAHVCRERQIICHFNGDKAYDSDKDRNKLAIMGLQPLFSIVISRQKMVSKRGRLVSKNSPMKNEKSIKNDIILRTHLVNSKMLKRFLSGNVERQRCINKPSTAKLFSDFGYSVTIRYSP